MSVELSYSEIADAICRGHLAGYADPTATKREQGANRFGIAVEYSQGNKQIRFTFVPRHFQHKSITITVDVEAFATDPVGYMGRFHHAINKSLDDIARGESPIMLLNDLPGPNKISQAMSKEIH